MRAIQVSRFGGPEVLELCTLPDPEPRPDEVVVELQAIGVNPVDTYIRSGSYGERPLPYVPGSDGAGLIRWVGRDIPRWREGDRVYLMGSQTGTYASLARCRGDQLQPLPEGISFGQGAALYVPYSTAYRALFQRARARAGEWVFVHGASGGVGLAAVQWARASGMQVVGSAGSQAGLELVLAQGAHQALDHRDPDYLRQLVNCTGGSGPAVILEMLANVNLQKDLEVLAPHGRIVVIGSRGSLEFTPRAAMTKDADVLGMSLFNTPGPALASIQKAIVAGLETGFLNPVVGRSLPLSEAAEAHRLILEPGALGKLVLLP